VILEKDDVAWGPNNKFRFPLHGGTGEIYRRMAKRFPGKVRTGKQLSEVDTAQRKVSFADGTGDHYDVLISTAPVDLLAGMLKPAQAELRDAATLLEHNDLLVLGIGLKKRIDTGKCWVYFADPEMPCYRATFFSHYSPFNVPNGDTEQYSSLMCEMSVPLGQTLSVECIYEQMLAGLIRSKILEESDRARIISRYHRLVRYSYPIPTLDRDRALAILQPELMKQGIYSRGRFGAWRYEIGNMDHSVMMGVEVANHVVNGEKELVFYST
jgi:protoporphyrinogen oxidase